MQLTPNAGDNSLECGDLSPLWSLGGLTPSGLEISAERWSRQVATGQSGDRSPHSTTSLAP